MELPRIQPREVKRRLDAGERVAFVDTRSSIAWGDATAKLPGAVRIPVKEVDVRAGGVPRDALVVAYCT